MGVIRNIANLLICNIITLQHCENAKQLAFRMGLEYFEYDPAMVRAKMMSKN